MAGTMCLINVCPGSYHGMQFSRSIRRYARPAWLSRPPSCVSTTMASRARWDEYSTGGGMSAYTVPGCVFEMIPTTKEARALKPGGRASWPPLSGYGPRDAEATGACAKRSRGRARARLVHHLRGRTIPKGTVRSTCKPVVQCSAAIAKGSRHRKPHPDSLMRAAGPAGRWHGLTGLHNSSA
jgi:hypothetical protein